MWLPHRIHNAFKGLKALQHGKHLISAISDVDKLWDGKQRLVCKCVLTFAARRDSGLLYKQTQCQSLLQRARLCFPVVGIQACFKEHRDTDRM